MFEHSNNILIHGGTFTEHHHAQSSEAIKRLLEASSLGALHNSGERFDPPKCHPNTRTAVLQKLMDWFIGVFLWNKFMLWLYGPAGAGKSAIAQTFAELCAAKNGLLASFFFSRSSSRRNNEKAFVATLAYQLWLRIPESRTILEAAIDNNPAIFQLNFDTQFRTLFLDPLLQLSSAGRFTSATPFPNLIIIDGLDECHGDDIQNTVLNIISNAFQYHSSALPFKLLIASRPEYHLTTSFSVAPLHSLTIRLALDDTYRPDEDIKFYLTGSFGDIRKTHIMRAHLPDSWPSEKDIAKLVAKSSGQFIYAVTVIRYVSSPRHNPLNRLKVIQGLLGHTRNLILYISIFFLTWKMSKQSCKLLHDLEKFMQLTPGTVQLLLMDILSVVDASDNKKPIKFLHASFSDFLIDPTRSHQFFINPSKRHEEAAHFCISAIESLDIGRPLQTYAYQSLLNHLRLAGPLHDNTTLRKKVFEVPYIQHWRNYVRISRDAPFKYRQLFSQDPASFVHFLQTSQFRQSEELYLHHRSILDQKLREDLALVPMSPCLAFWTAVCASGILEHGRTVSLQIFWALTYPPILNILFYVPAFLFSALLSPIEVVNGRVGHEWLGGFIGTPYLPIVGEFLNDPSRAGPHVVDQLTYTTAAAFAVEFAVTAWDGTKSISLHPYRGEQWNFIWDAFTFMLSKAGYSAELVNMVGQKNLTFNLGRPSTNVRHRVQTLFAAVRDYFKQLSPLPFKIIINWTQRPSYNVDNCFTAEDLDDDGDTRRVFYIDESILPSDEDTQGLEDVKEPKDTPEPEGKKDQPCGNT
ncbi:hypothetical protein CVT25_008089 [Psilocybe cyanescens]|uniref:NACHT domain-containing protein n=1 Tax=Psilocybe cyanescens TaxID=93625 RepID=A0A409X6T1_PSICY|nr:hypothetical protein CVT25_008089 [Psilocybe cyanescens]